MAKSNQEGASGEENNKGQAHDCAVCYGHMMYVVIERNKGGGEGFRVLSVCSGSEGNYGSESRKPHFVTGPSQLSSREMAKV